MAKFCYIWVHGVLNNVTISFILKFSQMPIGSAHQGFHINFMVEGQREVVVILNKSEFTC